MFEFPVLLVDIGGTNARFAVVPGLDEPAVTLPSTLTALHAGPTEAMRAALAGWDGPRPRSAFLAVATRVDAPVVRLTNCPWVIDAADIGSRFQLSRVVLVNDYVPVVASLAALHGGQADLARLGPEVPRGGGAMLALGPGTGLGAGALLPFGDRLAIQSTEAGHMDFGPSTRSDMTLWSAIEHVGGRVTAETLLSGPGLLRLYQACAAAVGRAAPCSTPEDVTLAGIAGTDALAVEALRVFARLLGRFAGDLALVFDATGGIFIGGGIAPRMVDILRSGPFRAGFEDKAPYTDLMRRIPTYVLTQPVPAFSGLAEIVSRPDRFVFPKEIWPDRAL